MKESFLNELCTYWTGQGGRLGVDRTKSVGEQRGREQGLYWGGAYFLLGCSSLSRQDLLGDALLDWPIAPTV